MECRVCRTLACARTADWSMTAENPYRVLIVDDCCDVADSLALVFALRGYDVRKAYSGETGLVIAQEYLPHVVILDLLLPDMDGYLLAEVFRSDSRWRNAFLIAYTGDATHVARERCAGAGIDVYVLKPIDPEHLVDIVMQSQTAEPASCRRFRLYQAR